MSFRRSVTTKVQFDNTNSDRSNVALTRLVQCGSRLVCVCQWISITIFEISPVRSIWHKRWNLANGSTAILSPKFKQLLNVRTLCIRIISTERDCIALRHYTHWGSSHKAGFSSFCVDHISWITDGCMPVRVSFTCETLLSQTHFTSKQKNLQPLSCRYDIKKVLLYRRERRNSENTRFERSCPL